jgi:hypothetical protein
VKTFRRLALLYHRISLDIRMGRCSGFRWCCIGWFVCVWRWFPEWLRVRYLDALNDQTPRVDWGYVPCPGCALHRKPVEVRRCTLACGHSLEAYRLGRDRAIARGNMRLASAYQEMVAEYHAAEREAFYRQL